MRTIVLSIWLCLVSKCIYAYELPYCFLETIQPSTISQNFVAREYPSLNQDQRTTIATLLTMSEDMQMTREFRKFLAIVAVTEAKMFLATERMEEVIGQMEQEKAAGHKVVSPALLKPVTEAAATVKELAVKFSFVVHSEIVLFDSSPPSNAGQYLSQSMQLHHIMCRVNATYPLLQRFWNIERFAGIAAVAAEITY